MSLIKLQQKFNDQRNSDDNWITINSATLQSADLSSINNFDQLIEDQLMVSGFLKVQTKDPIPQPEGEGNHLTFSGFAYFLEPHQPESSQILREITLVFKLDSLNSSMVNLLIQGDDWSLVDSFPTLPAYPFQKLILTHETLLFSTREISSFPWQKNASVKLEAGLNYVARLQYDGVLNILLDLLPGFSSAEGLLLSGTVDPSKITPSSKFGQVPLDQLVIYPDINLVAPIASKPVQLPWAKLTFNAPQIAIRTDTYNQSVQEFELNIEIETKLNGKNLSLQASIPESLNQLCFEFTPEDRSQSLTIPDITSLLGGYQFNNALPEELQEAFKKVGLRGLAATFELQKNSIPVLEAISVTIGTTSEWVLVKDYFVVEDIVFDFYLLGLKSKPNWVYFSAKMAFFPKVFTGDFVLQMEHQVGSKETYISGEYQGDVHLSKILSGISGGTVSLPKSIDDVIFSDFNLTLNKYTEQWYYKFNGSTQMASTIQILERKLQATFSISVSGSKNSHQFHLIGGVQIGSTYFNFTVTLSSSEKIMQASWFQLGEPLGLNDLAQSLGFDDFSIPEELDLGLKAASFTYNLSEKVFSLTADSETWGKVTLSSVRDENKKNQLIFFCHLPESKSIDGGVLPLVGDELKGNLKLSELQFLISTADFESVSIDVLEGSSVSTVELSNVKRGVTFMSELTLGSDVQELTIPIYQPKTKKKTLALEASNELTVDSQPDNLGGASRVGKSLGPFNFKEFGVSLKDKKLTFQLDASLITSGLEIHLNDLGLAFPPSNPTDISTSLSGLALRFSGGPLSIEGGLVHNIDAEVESYDGQLTIALKKLMISALGSYAKTEEGYPSLFTFAVIDYPLGGPPFFFVTGGALGFGYNRDLIAPSIDGVRDFPLIQAAFGDSDFEKGNDSAALAHNLEQMIDVIPIKQGQNWFGLGVKFRSFSLINGFALTTLSFGNQTEAHILGLATAQIPFTGKKPIAYIELALLASFIPDKGVVSIEGALTDRSFLFSENCKLTGGFAFYLWFDRDHAGDFVLTAGGYHPTKFNIPDYYPKPQRIGVNWQITRQLSITGESYFALTSSAIMAGSLLNCQWKSGSLRAWFLLGFDFIISWQPFYYDAAVYASIGVSARIKVLWVRKTVTVHVGANIHIWGPEFSGKVRVKVWFVSFTISFGAGGKQQIGPITWTEFKEACLPSSDNILSLQVSKGLIKDASKETGVKGSSTTTDVVDWIVDPANLVLEINSLIPIKEATFAETSEKTPTDFGVSMVRIPSTDFTSDLNVVLTVLTKNGEEIPLDSTDFTVEPVTKSVPAAMWKYDSSKDDAPDINNPLVKDVLTGLIIKPVTSSPDTTVPVATELLEASLTHISELEFGDSKVQPISPLSQEEAMGRMTTTISGDSTVDTNRDTVLDALAKWDKHIDTKVDLSKTKLSAETYWTAAPTLSKLGYEKSVNS